MLNKMLQKLQEKFRDNRLFQKGGFLAPASEPKQKKLPIFKLLFSPINQLFDNLKLFFALSFSASLVLALMAIILNFPINCSYSSELSCSNSASALFVFILFKIFVLSFVFLKWFDLKQLNNAFAWRDVLQLDKRNLVFYAQILLALFLNIFSLAAFLFLYYRVPNPNWQIESLIFAICFLFIVSPFVYIRFYPIFGCVVFKHKRLPLKVVWKKTAGNQGRILFGFFFVLTIGLFFLSSVLHEVRIASENINWYSVFVSEILYEWVFVFSAMMLFNNIIFQYNYLFNEEKNEKN